MKRHITLLLSVLLIALALVSCSGGHQHTYSDEWQKNDTNHWHASTCTDGEDCKAAKASEAKHEDANNDKACDVCGYDYNHTHAYADTLTGDETGHFKAATCGCTIEGKDKTSHIDANLDGACDDCAYDGGHKHELTNNWGMDEEQHWKTVSCGHNVKAEAAAHDFDEVGLCKVCGYSEDELTVEKAIEIGVFYEKDVVGGKVILVKDTSGQYYEIETTDYLFGQGAIKLSYNVTSVSEYPYTEEYVTHLILSGEDSIFAVREGVDYDDIYKPYDEYTVNSLNGYHFADVNYDTIGSGIDFYGVAEFIKGLYNFEGTESSIVVKDGVTYYTFSTTTYSWDTYVALTVEFTLGEDNIFENVTVSYTSYYTNDEKLPMGILPKAVYVYEIEQTTEGEEYEPKYSPEKMLVSEFELAEGEMDYDTGDVIYGTSYKDGATITIEAGKYTSLYLKPIAPTTANIDFDTITVTSDKPEASFDYWDGAIYTYGISASGTYQITVSTTNASATFTLKVVPAQLTELTVTVNDQEYYSYDTPPKFVLLDTSVSVIIGAKPNTGAVTNYTVSLAEGTVGATLNGETLTVTAPGTYTVIVKDGDITSTLDIEVVEPAVFVPAEVFSGTYTVTVYGKTCYTIVFNPNAGGETGAVTVVDNNGGLYTGEYTYAYANGAVTYSPELPFYFDAATATFLWENDDWYDVSHTAGGSSVVNTVAPADGYYAACTGDNTQFNFELAGETLTVIDGGYAGTYTWNAESRAFTQGMATVSFTDPDDCGEYCTIAFPRGKTYTVKTAERPEGGNGGSGDVSALIDGHAFQYGGYVWILDFGYCWFDNTYGTYIEFTYIVDGNEIILTPKGADLGIFEDSTLTYDEASNSIKVVLADTTEMIFYFDS